MLCRGAIYPVGPEEDLGEGSTAAFYERDLLEAAGEVERGRGRRRRSRAGVLRVDGRRFRGSPRPGWRPA